MLTQYHLFAHVTYSIKIILSRSISSHVEEVDCTVLRFCESSPSGSDDSFENVIFDGPLCAYGLSIAISHEFERQTIGG